MCLKYEWTQHFPHSYITLLTSSSLVVLIDRHIRNHFALFPCKTISHHAANRVLEFDFPKWVFHELELHSAWVIAMDGHGDFFSQTFKIVMIIAKASGRESKCLKRQTMMPGKIPA